MQKIMFNDRYGLTTAVLDGCKTMTRRVVPECKALDILRLWERNEGAVATGYEEKTQSFRFDYRPDKKRRISIDHLNLTPSYKVGEEVAIAQKYSECFYRIEINGGRKNDKKLAGWDNKMFVKAELMPHRIRITDIRVERLQDISEEDSIREGIEWCHGSQSYYVNYIPETGFRYWLRGKTAREAFAFLIDKISGKGTWASNPFVWVYSFDVIK